MKEKFDELLHHYTVGGLQTHLLTVKYGSEQVTKECKCLYADEVEKFAELIVRECARVAIQKQTENDIDNIVSKNPAKDFADALIKHFGVKG
jgi:hypothetical protein